MIVCDPYTVNTLVHNVFRQLQILSGRKGQFPKRSDDTTLLLKLLTLAISAWEIIDKQNFKVSMTLNLLNGKQWFFESG